jgi:plasmid stabilization system protein ParE
LSPIKLFALHPYAYNDIDEIREFIADDNSDAADRVVTEVFDGIRSLVSFPQRELPPPLASHHARFGSGSCVNM